MGLRFDPIGGGQFKQAVKQIIEAEREPIKRLEARKTKEEARLKLFQEFKTKFATLNKTLEDFSSFKKFRDLKADLGDATGLMSVTIDKDTAEPGTYTMQIDQLAERTSVISNGFKDPDLAELGIGFVVANKRNGETAEIFIDTDNASIRGISRLINQRSDLPFHASVIKDAADFEKPWRLLLTSKKDGTEAVGEFPDFYFLDGAEELYVHDDHDFQNALIMLDGFELEAEGNDIKDFLQGVNVHLKQARPDQTFTLKIEEDYQKISGKMKMLIENVNGVLEFIYKQNAIDEQSDTSSTFAGDTSLQTVEYRLRNILHEGFAAGDPESEGFKFYFLHQLGVEFEKSGKLKFNEEKFTKNLENEFDMLAEAITGPYGFAHQLKTIVDGYSQFGTGMLSLREQGLRNRVKRIDDDIARKEMQVERKAKSVTEQFARLQASLSGMQRQQAALSATLPAANAGNPIAAMLGG